MSVSLHQKTTGPRDQSGLGTRAESALGAAENFPTSTFPRGATGNVVVTNSHSEELAPSQKGLGYDGRCVEKPNM